MKRLGFLFLFCTPLSAVPVAPILRERIVEAATRYRIDPRLVEAMVEEESAGVPHAVSPKGARGLLQIMPRTADELGVANSFHVQSNLMGACEYLRVLMNKYRFKIPLVLAAYNAGPGKVAQYGGIPPFNETRRYVKNVLSTYKRLRDQKL
jgi:soluble lytic murein transglycosylase-like protein